MPRGVRRKKPEEERTLTPSVIFERISVINCYREVAGTRVQIATIHVPQEMDEAFKVEFDSTNQTYYAETREAAEEMVRLLEAFERKMLELSK